MEEDEKNKRVLLYPKVEKTFKHSILKPNYYYCKNDDYPYIGYVEIKKKSEEHPYSGFAPCCFKTSRAKSNEKIQKFLTNQEAGNKKSRDSNNLIAFERPCFTESKTGLGSFIDLVFLEKLELKVENFVKMTTFYI